MKNLSYLLTNKKSDSKLSVLSVYNKNFFMMGDSVIGNKEVILYYKDEGCGLYYKKNMSFLAMF